MSSRFNFYTSIVITNLPKLGKVKVDICTLPCEIKSIIPFLAKSLVSKETYEGLKPDKNGWSKFEKTKDVFFYQKIYETDSNDLIKAEKGILPEIKKELFFRLLFHPNYKKALCKKIKKLL